jgi:hypothetical protein
MWIRKTTSEVILARRAKLLRTTGLSVLLGAGLWYILVRFFMIFDVLPRDAVSECVACAVIAVILPAAWFDNWRTERKGKSTIICDRCNRVKAADGQLGCNCGGQYFTLAEMKWIDPAPTRTDRQSA